METATFFSALGYFSFALIMALMEIEIEGKFGWGEKLPTWKRHQGFLTKMIPGRPATGYWLYVNLLVILFFHIGFFNGQDWSLEAETIALSRWLICLPVWDFMWFVFNPNYKIKNFKKENIKWFNGTKWFFGLMPMDYIFGVLGSSAIAYYLDWQTDAWSNLTFNLYFLSFVMPAILVAPLYHRHYWRMRKNQN